MGKSGGSSGQSQKVDSFSNLSREQRKLLKQLVAQVSGEIGEGADVYEGPISPGATDNDLAAFGMASHIGGDNRSSRRTATERGILEMLSGEPAFDVDPEARKNLYEAERAEEMRRFQEEVLPAMSRAYGARGLARSGGLERSMRLGSERLGEDLYRRNTEMLYDDEKMRREEMSAARDRIGAGVEADRIARGSEATDIGTLVAAGGAERAIQGGLNQEAYNKWLAGQSAYNPWMGYLAPALGTQQNTPVSKSETDWASLGIQAGTSLVGLAAAY